MECFNHRQVLAIGMCRHCNRGLCVECVCEVSGVLSCRGTCEQEVKDSISLVNKGKSAYSKTAKYYMANAIFFGVLTLAMTAAAFGSDESNSKIGYTFVGALFLFMSISSWRVGQKINSAKS